MFAFYPIQGFERPITIPAKGATSVRFFGEWYAGFFQRFMSNSLERAFLEFEPLVPQAKLVYLVFEVSKGTSAMNGPQKIFGRFPICL